MNGTKLTKGLNSDILLVLSEAVLVISKAVIVIEKLSALFLCGLPDLGNDTAEIAIAQLAGLSVDCRRLFLAPAES